MGGSKKLKRGPHNLFVSYAKGEVDFRKKHFKDVNDLFKFKEEWKCTMCSCNLEQSILKGVFSKHPALGVLVCHKCLEYYGDGLFSPDEEGEDKFCRWCAQGGELYCCSKCVCTFCKKCVRRHFKDNRKVMKSLDSEDWKCFLCEPKPIWFLRALYWAVYNFKKDFVDESSTSRDSTRRKSLNQSRAISNKENGTSSSSDEETHSSKNNSKNKHRSHQSKRSKVESEKDDSNDSDDESKKPDRSKRNGREKLNDRNISKNNNTEDISSDESNRVQEIKKKTLGPKSKREKANMSLDVSKISKVNDGVNEDTKRNLVGPKSRRKYRDSSEERENTEDDTDEKSTERSNSRREKDEKSVPHQSSHKKDQNTSSDEEEERPSSRNSKKIKRLQKNVKKMSKIEENTDSCEEENIKTTKKPVGSLSKIREKEISEKENDKIKEVKVKKVIGPKSKKINIKTSSHQKGSPPSSSDEEKESSSNEKEKKSKIGPKSRVVKSSERRVNKTSKNKNESSDDSSGEEIKVEDKSKSKKVNPASKKDTRNKETSDEGDERGESASYRKTRGLRAHGSRTSGRTSKRQEKDSSDEGEVETSFEPKSKKRKKNASKEETSDEEKEVNKNLKYNKKIKQEDSKESSENDSKSAPERAADIFQETLDLSESLAMDIRKKTDKLKKLSNSSKFGSARNTTKIFTLLLDEMKNNSNLFLHLAEVVENHIGNIDRLFDDKTNSIYDQTTMVDNETEKCDENDANMEEADTSPKTTAKKKKKKNTEEKNQGVTNDEKDNINEVVLYNEENVRSDGENNIKEVTMDEKVPDINSILSSDEEEVETTTKETINELDSKRKKSKKTHSKGPKSILTSDSEEPVPELEDSKMNEDESPKRAETPKPIGLADILSSDNSDADNNCKIAEKSSTSGKQKKNDKKSNNKKHADTNLSSDELVQEKEDSKMDKDDLDNESPKSARTPKSIGLADILSSDNSDADNNSKIAEKSRTSGKQKKSDKKSNDEKHVDIKSILSSDSDNNNEVPDESETIALDRTLSTSDPGINKTEQAQGESEYFSLKSESDMDDSVDKGNTTPKAKRRGSCKDEKSSRNEAKSDASDNDKQNKSSKNKRNSTDDSSSGCKTRKSERSETSKIRKDSIDHLTTLSSLDVSPVQKSKSNSKRAETSSSEKAENSSSEKSSRASSEKRSLRTPSKKKKNKKEDKDKSLLEFLNENDSSSAEELEESTEVLSNLIKAKAEEAKKQNEEMIKQGLLRAEDESNKEESDDDIVLSDIEKPSTSKSKVKKEKKDTSSDSEKEKRRTKKRNDRDSWKNDRLLKEKLSDTDTSEGEAKMKKKKAEDLITLSSDEELFSKRKTKKESSDDSDCFVVKKKLAKKRKARLRDSSDSSDVQVLSSSEDSDKASSESDFKKKVEKTKKRSRIKKMKDSDDEDNSDDGDGEKNASQGTPGKGRKNIRHILTNEELTLKTITASKAEEDRKQRIEERQALYNKLFKIKESSDETITKLVLDFDEKSKTELISVHPDLVSKLKPHQVGGVRFMFNACFESVQQIKKNKAGSGCILAHCMGLGKTLQVVTLVHTLMTHKELTKVNRVMVVTPLNTVSNWVDEFHNWLKNINNGDDCETFNLIKNKKDYERSYTLNCWFEEGGVLIIGYEMFRNLINKRGLSKKVKTTVHKALLDPGPDLVVCDEGHILKNEASAVSKAMCQIKSLRRIILTGTPLQNNLEEYHCMVQFVKPNLLGDKKEFKNRFANPINNGQYIDSTPRDVKIMKRRAHVLYKMLDGIVQRRDYNVLTPFLPPKYEYVISIKLTDLQIKLYSHYLSSQASEADGKHRLFADYQALKLVWTHPWTLNSASLSKQRRDEAKLSDSEGSLKEFIDDDDEEEESSGGSSDGSKSSEGPAKKKPRVVTRGARNRGEISEEEKEEEAAPSFWWTSLVSDEDIENITNSNKLLAFMFVLKQCEEIGDKLLVFSQSLETLSMLEHFLNKIDECSQDGTLDPNLSQFQASWTLGLDYFRLDGSSSSEDRSYWVKSFNNPTNLRARLFLISTKAGGLGINLVAANRVIIFDVSWNPSHDIQSIFRVFRFGQKKPCYIYRFLAQGTMEEKIYDRQVAKQSMSCRVVDEQQIDRHFTRSDISELYEFKPDEKKDRKTPALPKDRLMAEMIKEMDSKIVAFHEHDSLLENVQDEELNEEERKAAWDEYESEKSKPAMSAGMTYVNNLIMQNTMKQQQAGNIAPGGAANLSNLKLDNMHMLNYLKASNPDVSEGALLKIVDQNVQRLEDYKKRQEAQFQQMVLNMHQGMAQSYANQMMNKNLAGVLPGMRMPGIPGMPGMPGQMPAGFNTMGRGVPRPNIMRPRGPTGVDIMRRVAPMGNNPRPRPPQPRPTGPGSSSSTPIEIEL